MKISFGRMRSGKTFAAVLEIVRSWRRKPRRKRMILDWQGDLGRLVIRENLYRKDRIFVDEIRRLNRTCKTVGLFESSAEDDLQRLAENQLNRYFFGECNYNARNLNRFDNVLIDERFDQASEILQFQRQFKPPYFLEDIHLFSRSYGELIAGCHDYRAREQVKAWFYLNQFQFRSEIGPLKRLLKPLTDAHVMARCGLIDPLDVIRAYDFIIVMGDGASDAGAMYMLTHWFFKALLWVILYREEIEVTFDEVDKCGKQRQGIFSDFVLRALKLLEKHGLVDCHFIMQTPHALAPEIIGELLDMAKQITTHALGDPGSVKLMAEIMGTPNYNPYKVHHVEERERSLPDGHEEVEIREVAPGARRIIRPDKPGFDEWSQGYDYMPGDLRTRKVLVTKQRQVIDKIISYASESQQHKDTEKKIATLSNRERFVRDGPSAWKEEVQTLQNPYLWPECSDRRIDQFLEEILERPEFTKTRIIKPTARPWVRGKQSGKQ